MKAVIGIDLGGTNVRVAKVTQDGTILQEVKSPSYALEGPDKVCANIIAQLHKIEGVKDCLGIGIGVPGPVDTIRKVMKMSTNIPGMTDYPLAAKIEAEFGIPVYLDNDANVAGLAEALLGAGKGLPVVFYITHSTGIGGALIVNGKVVSGRNGYAGEIGNIIVTRDGEKINHLNIGAVENRASGVALVKAAQQQLDPSIDSAYSLFLKAQAGDPVANKIVDTMAYDFASMCSAIGHVCDPYAFIIGGGVSQSHDLYFDKIKTYYNQLVHVGMRDVPFLLAQLDEPGILGAAMLPVSFAK